MALINMKRQTQKPYARRFLSFPVLVPAREGEPFDGFRNFLSKPKGMKGVWRTPKVHIVTESDLTPENLVRLLSRPDLDLIYGALELRAGMRQHNRQALRSAYEKLLPYLGWDGVSESVKEFFAGGPWAIHYAQVATSAMTGARPVLWWYRDQYQFAFYCDGWRAATFLSFILERMRLCPCGKVFSPSKTNVWYCKPQHSAYYRLKRWRHKQKTEGKKVRPKPDRKGHR